MGRFLIENSPAQAGIISISVGMGVRPFEIFR